ncbi:MAG: PAS domain S-box protein [Cyanobacteria bacterium P01_E01_bin.42]
MLGLFSLMCVPIASVTFFFYASEVKKAQVVLEVETKHHLNRARDQVQDEFYFILSDIQFLARENALRDLFAESASAIVSSPSRRALEQEYLHFSQHKSFYDQVRFLDKKGTEIVRVNWNEGKPLIVPIDKLQNKQNRYYFRETFQLDANEIFISPFDLNVEQGEIEQPLKPMIRFGMPVLDRNGTKQGIVLINYLGRSILTKLQRHLDTPDTLMLLNEESYWLMGAKPEELWGFMYPDRKDRKFSQRFPKEWQQIQASQSGHFYTSNGLFIFVTVSPWQNRRSSLDNRDRDVIKTGLNRPAEVYSWKLVSHVSPGLIQKQKIAAFDRLFLPFLSWIAISACLSYLLIRIQHRKQAEELRIQRMNEFFRNILDALADPLYVIDVNTYEIVIANQAARELGHPEPYTCHKLTHHRETPCEGDRDPCPLELLKETRKPTVVEHVHFDGDGTPAIVEVHGYPIFDLEGNLLYMVEYSMDITERRRTEEQIHKLSQAVEQSANTILITDRIGRIEYVNPKCCQTTGYSVEEMIGKTPKLFKSGRQTKEYYETLWATIRSGREWRGEFCNRRKDGSLYWEQASIAPLLDERGKITNFIAVKEDITDRKKTEEKLQRSQAELQQKAKDLTQTLQELRKTQSQLIQTEKMSSLMQLVAGIAHEINNPATFITNNLFHLDGYSTDLIHLIKLYQENYPHPPVTIAEELESIEFDYLCEDMSQLIGSMNSGIKRINTIVTSLRTFSRLDESDLKLVDIHDGLDSAILLLEGFLKDRKTGGEIEIERDYGTLPQVECYAGHLNQVFMNILKNAIDVLHDSQDTESSDRPKKITVQTSAIEENERRVAIYIRDNGPGIKSEILPRIFDPFFTTKPVGKGTGLGLAVSYEIIKEKHHGELKCYSTFGEGTEFAIVIPCVQSS